MSNAYLIFIDVNIYIVQQVLSQISSATKKNYSAQTPVFQNNSYIKS